MIISVDLNPVLLRKYFLDNLEFDTPNIPQKVSYKPAGAGIDLAYLLSGLNENTLYTGFLGGVNGKAIERHLIDGGISNEFFAIKDETAETIVISTDKREDITINSNEPRITREELEGFLELYLNQIYASSLVCVVGNLPQNVSKEIFYTLIDVANKYYKKTLFSATGEELAYGIEAGPYMVVLDTRELENFTNLKLDYEYEIIKAGQYIIEKGCKIVVISLGSKGSIVLTKENVFRVDIANLDFMKCKVNYAYMIGGFAMAIERNYDFEMMLKIGHSCGIVNCHKSNEEIDMSDIKRIMGDIVVNKFNY